MRSDSEEDLRRVPRESNDYYEDFGDRKPNGEQTDEKKYDVFNDQAESMMITDEPNFPPEQLRKMMNTETTSSGSTRGCVAFALDGNCYKRKDCKYARSHYELLGKPEIG